MPLAPVVIPSSGADITGNLGLVGARSQPLTIVSPVNHKPMFILVVGTNTIGILPGVTEIILQPSLTNTIEWSLNGFNCHLTATQRIRQSVAFPNVSFTVVCAAGGMLLEIEQQ